MPKIIQICPTSGDWYLVHDAPGVDGGQVVHSVATWALLDDGSVVGLIGDIPKGGNREIPTLEYVPSLASKYLKAESLTEKQRALIHPKADRPPQR